MTLCLFKYSKLEIWKVNKWIFFQRWEWVISQREANLPKGPEKNYKPSRNQPNTGRTTGGIDTVWKEVEPIDIWWSSTCLTWKMEALQDKKKEQRCPQTNSCVHNKVVCTRNLFLIALIDCDKCRANECAYNKGVGLNQLLEVSTLLAWLLNSRRRLRPIWSHVPFYDTLMDWNEFEPYEREKIYETLHDLHMLRYDLGYLKLQRMLITQAAISEGQFCGQVPQLMGLQWNFESTSYPCVQSMMLKHVFTIWPNTFNTTK